MTCPDCHGLGRRIIPGRTYQPEPVEVICTACRGKGVVGQPGLAAAVTEGRVATASTRDAVLRSD
jgi:DnaJ-class molecular chaperone